MDWSRTALPPHAASRRAACVVSASGVDRIRRGHEVAVRLRRRRCGLPDVTATHDHYCTDRLGATVTPFSLPAAHAFDLGRAP